MAITGVTSSEYYSQLLSNSDKNLPKKVPIYTTEPDTSGEEVAALMTGAMLEFVSVSQLISDAAEGQKANVTPEGTIKYDTVDKSSVSVIVEGNFDDETGILTLVKDDNTVFEIPGFLKQIDFGVGKTGGRGLAGADGTDGEDGEDGEQGPCGCDGADGEQGDQGPKGDQGIDGLLGLQGDMGCDGTTGDKGAKGRAGIKGFEGPRGRKGLSCDPSIMGPAGEDGQSFGFTGYGQESMAEPSNAFIIIEEDDAEEATPPAGGWEYAVPNTEA